jgi:flavin-dependent dehydrogenase
LSSRTADVAILGGGPAGCATAVALARAGVSVCVTAPQRGAAPAVGETLLPDSAGLLEELGLWRRFLEEGHEPSLGTCSAWGSDEVGYHDFVLSVRGRGWHLDRARFDAGLLAAAESAGAAVVHGARFVSPAVATADGFRLQIVDRAGAPTALTARFVVDATGHRAVFARGRGARRVQRDRLMFVYGFFDVVDAAAPLRLTMVEAVETGWWYAAPLPGGRVAVAFASDPAHVRDAGLARSERWLPALLATRHVAARLGGCRLRRGLVARVAPSGLTEPVSGACWLAVGDAAAAYDPLSARGIHKALENGIDAAGAIARALAAGTGETPEYAAAVAEEFGAYRAERDHFYAAEPRWPRSRFWARRIRARRGASANGGIDDQTEEIPQKAGRGGRGKDDREQCD